MLWVKSFHIIFMVTWFAGLFYLPRLFVYHAETSDEISHERFTIMERKLFIIMTIGAVGTYIFGFWLVLSYAWTAFGNEAWFQLKLGLVLLLTVYHIFCYRLTIDFRKGENKRGHVYYRWINEVPALFLIAIVILVMVKPWTG